MVISRTLTAVVPRLSTAMPSGDAPSANVLLLTPLPGVADTVPAQSNVSAATTLIVLAMLNGGYLQTAAGSMVNWRKGGSVLDSVPSSFATRRYTPASRWKASIVRVSGSTIQYHVTSCAA